MSEELRSIVLGTLGLSVAAAVAAVLTFTRAPISAARAAIESLRRVLVMTVALQSLHFLEELATGFHQRFPQWLGLAPWSATFFVAFNLFWIAVWVAGVPGIAARRTWALLALWFLALACCANGVAHPLLALAVGGYFPGLVTSPFLGLAGALLLRRLLATTQPRPITPGP